MSANHLHFWLSARREGSWPQFRAAVEQLHLAGPSTREVDEEDERRADGLPLYRRLQFGFERLGHAEFFSPQCDGGWRVAPGVLAVTSHETYWTGLLCGARLPALLNRARDCAGDLVITESSQPDGPNVFTVSAHSSDRLAEFAAALGLRIQLEPSRALLAVLPPLDEWKRHRTGDLPAGNGWEICRFSASQLKWVTSSRSEAERRRLGFFRFSYRYQRGYFLCRGGVASSIPVQLGKFIVLRMRRRKRGILRYDNDTRSLLAVPICHPPPLIERALVLCSGRLPSFDHTTGMLRYGGVNPEIAKWAAGILRQEIR